MIGKIIAILVVAIAIILGFWWGRQRSVVPILYWATVVGVENGQDIDPLLPPLQSSNLVGVRMFKANDPFTDGFGVDLPSIVDRVLLAAYAQDPHLNWGRAHLLYQYTEVQDNLLMNRGWLAGNLVQQLLPLLQCNQRYTAKDIEQQETLLLLKPNIANDVVITENIKKIVKKNGLDVCISNTKILSNTQVTDLYRDHVGRPYFNDLLSYISSGPAYFMILTGPDAIKVTRRIVGPTDPVVARNDAPDSLRALYGVDLARNSIHASDSLAAAAHEIQIICSL